MVAFVWHSGSVRGVLADDSDVRVQKPVKSFGPVRQFTEVSLERFGEAVEKAPDRPLLESFVPGFAPLPENGRDQAIAAHTGISGSDDQVVCVGIGDDSVFVGRDAGVLVVPLLNEPADGAFHKLRQVTADEPRVLSGELHLTGKAEVVTDENRRSGDDSRREGLVVGVSQPKHPAVVTAGRVRVNFHEPEVPLAVVRERVRLGSDR